LSCFREDAERLGVKLRIVAMDLRPEFSAACQVADASYEVPRCSDAHFVPALLDICRREEAALVIPTIDTELPILSRATEAFAAVGTRVVVSAEPVVNVARDKAATARLLAVAGVMAPKTLTWDEFVADPVQLRDPVIAKPVGGSSSVGIIRPRRSQDLMTLAGPGYIVQELWTGAEYTVNVYFDQKGRLSSAVPHRRLEVRAGEVSKGRTERVPSLEAAAQKLAAVLPGASGPLCFQAMVTETGEYCVFEINARFGGGYPLAHRAGARFSQWLLEEAAGLPLNANNDWRAGVTMLRFDHAVFLDA